MNLKRLCQRLMAAGLWLGVAASAGAATPADTFPNRPISIVVPYPAGGTTDALARLLGNKLSEVWKETVLVENRPGASGMIGTTYVARAKPDGHTWLLTVTLFIQAPALYKSVQYDPIKDFVPLAMLARATPSFVVGGDVPANSVQEYVELVKKDPAKYGALGNYGTGSMSHIYASLLDRQAGLGVAHVPYKGAAQLTTDILGGQVAAGMGDVNSVLPHLKSGRLKVLAMTGATPTSLLPGVPTLTSLGYKDFEATGWLGLFAPAGTPPEIVAKVSQEVAGILQREDVRETLRGVGIEAEQNTSQPEFAAMVSRDAGTWAKLIKDANIQLD